MAGGLRHQAAKVTGVIPGRCEASNPESRDSGSGANAPSRNDGNAEKTMMRHLLAAILSCSITLFAGNAMATDQKFTIAVFTKNATNPAYEAFRIAADQVARAAGAKVVHHVPKQPDNVGEQQAMVEQVLKDRPDAVVFIPVDDVAMIDSVKKLNQA